MRPLTPKSTSYLGQRLSVPELYMNKLYLKHKKTIDFKDKGGEKILSDTDDFNFKIPTIHDYEFFIKRSYNISQLKIISKHYKLKVGGTKPVLLARVSTLLWLSTYAIKLQRVFRGALERKYIKLHGPAARNRSLCTNDSDFVTLDNLNELPFHQFYSYKDKDEFVYGFDFASIYSLTAQKQPALTNKRITAILNPYNRSEIPFEVFSDLEGLFRLSHILKTPLIFEHVDDVVLSNEQMLDLRILKLFQTIDSLGNYSDLSWFVSLSKPKLVRLVREITDIWHYRAQLTPEIKRKICPPCGDPFRNSSAQLFFEDNINVVRKLTLDILEKLVNNGVNTDSRCLGAYYILGALTLVSEDAAASLPWLYQSML
jgi:hypothetical protein